MKSITNARGESLEGGAGNRRSDAAPPLRIAPEGWPFVLAPLVPAVALAWTGGPLFALPFLLASGASAAFFRDPEREIPSAAGVVVSPADGRVIGVSRADGRLQIAIFLSIFDVHVNRVPVAGTVVACRRKAGRFVAAFRQDASAANERNDLTIETEHGPVVVAQIAGLVARRIVCRAEIGQRVERGERFGLIRFGSRTDVMLPEAAVPLVTVGDKVRGGSTIVARFPSGGRRP